MMKAKFKHSRLEMKSKQSRINVLDNNFIYEVTFISFEAKDIINPDKSGETS